VRGHTHTRKKIGEENLRLKTEYDGRRERYRREVRYESEEEEEG